MMLSIHLESDESIAYLHGKILKTEDLSNGCSDLHLIKKNGS
jgi:hypothetical protein